MIQFWEKTTSTPYTTPTMEFASMLLNTCFIMAAVAASIILLLGIIHTLAQIAGVEDEK